MSSEISPFSQFLFNAWTNFLFQKHHATIGAKGWETVPEKSLLKSSFKKLFFILIIDIS
jgi:hypothetical protein